MLEITGCKYNGNRRFLIETNIFHFLPIFGWDYFQSLIFRNNYKTLAQNCRASLMCWNFFSWIHASFFEFWSYFVSSSSHHSFLKFKFKNHANNRSLEVKLKEAETIFPLPLAEFKFFSWSTILSYLKT